MNPIQRQASRSEFIKRKSSVDEEELKADIEASDRRQNNKMLENTLNQVDENISVNRQVVNTKIEITNVEEESKSESDDDLLEITQPLPQLTKTKSSALQFLEPKKELATTITSRGSSRLAELEQDNLLNSESDELDNIPMISHHFGLNRTTSVNQTG